jgi:ribonuclease P protein component
MGLPRKDRLTRRANYEAVRRQGSSVAGRWLVLGWLKDPDLQGFRAGFVVTKSLGGAVQRNATKRRLREIVRKNSSSLKGEHWIVSIARRGADRASYQTLAKEWLSLARRAGLVQTTHTIVPTADKASLPTEPTP